MQMNVQGGQQSQTGNLQPSDLLRADERSAGLVHQLDADATR